jgi:hypothetical protein
MAAAAAASAMMMITSAFMTTATIRLNGVSELAHWQLAFTRGFGALARLSTLAADNGLGTLAQLPSAHWRSLCDRRQMSKRSQYSSC